MAKKKSGSSNERKPQIVDHVSDSEDEEIEEDMAFNSDDERKYGAMFGGNGGGGDGYGDGDDDDDSSNEDDESVKSFDDEDSDGIASDDEAEDGDGGQYMLDLLNNMDKKEDTSRKEKEDARKSMAHSTLMKDSEFSTVAKGAVLTLDELMNGISDTKGFKEVQKTMKDMAPGLYDEKKRGLATTATPVAKVVSDRAQRKVAYEDNSKEVSQWVHVTKRNRHAETLDFRPKDRVKISKDELVDKFTATTDFEKEMAAALEEAGAADEKGIKDKEGRELFEDDDFGTDDDDDDLGRNKLSAEQYKKRHGELAKMRALMFYDEQKRHHINKIKSKKYRKIRKKQRDRLMESEDAEAAETDEAYAKELEEKAELERMKERMSLKHRNTSKWAKRVLRRGANVDSDTRKALSEQLRVGDELKRKMLGHYSDSDDDENANLVSQAKAILAETEKDDDSGLEKKGLFQMEFMKKGLEAQRERAKQEARALLQELQDNEESYSGNESEDKKGDDASSAKKKKRKTASSKEMEKVLPKGKLIASSLEFGNSNTVSVSGAIDLDVDETIAKSSSNKSSKTADIKVSCIEVDIEVEESSATPSKRLKPETKTRPTTDINEESNPWIRSSTDGTAKLDTFAHKGKKNKHSIPSVSKQGIVNVVDAINVLTGDVGDDAINDSPKTNSSKRKSSTDDNRKIASLSQEELVKKAFATISEDDIEKDFEKEKEAMRDRDDHLKKKRKEDDKKVSGWGSWAGDGAPAPRPPKKLPKKLQAPDKKIKKRARKDDGKKHVIISAKRSKKNAQFQIENIPYPYTSREQYERAMAGSMGKEWNVSGAVKDMTRPEVITRAGKIIRPISQRAKMKVKRAPLAKFKNRSD